MWRASKTDGDKRTWLTADLNILGQDPASPHPREGAALSTSTPLDANYNPSGAYLDETRIFVSGGCERPVAGGATWGTTASFTHSAQRIFRGFLTDISNSANNASGFKENIDINDLYADTHLVWPGEATPLHVGRRRAVRERQRGGRDLLLHGPAQAATSAP